MSNFIQITDKLAIASDSIQWMIQKPIETNIKNGDGEVIDKKAAWTGFEFYGSLESCVKGLGDHMLRNSNSRSYGDLVKAASDISLLLGQKFTASANIQIKEGK